MMLALFLLLALSAPGPELVLHDECDVIELNHFYDDQGRQVFDQVIFFTWDGRRHQVLDWRLVKQPSHLPHRNWSAVGEQWQCLWVDERDGNRLRRVVARSCRETWTQFDPELVERESLPKERRRLLRTNKPKPKVP